MSLEQLKNLKEIIDSLIDFSQSSIIKTNFVQNFYRCTIGNVLYGNYKLFGAKSLKFCWLYIDQ